MMDARKYEVTETLKDGTTVKIRAVRPADKTGVAEAFSRLEPESVYARFFHAKSSLSDQELAAATEVDFEHVVGLVVTIASAGREVIVGGGRYVVCDRAPVHSAEVAFLVEEDYHGRGIAGRVLSHLAQIARDKGISQFEAEVLPHNRAMLAVFLHSGLPMDESPSEDVIHVTLSLTARP